MNGPRLSEAEFFDVLDLELPALAGVKAAVAGGDWVAAISRISQDLIAYQCSVRLRRQGCLPDLVVRPVE